MRKLRERRRAQDLRELRLLVPDARSETSGGGSPSRLRRLVRESERDALKWIEAVAEFDADEAG